jgi:Rod binding domain-containing protein
MQPVSLSTNRANTNTTARQQAAANEFSRMFVEIMLRQASEPMWSDGGENSMPGASDMVNQCLAQTMAASDPFHIAKMVVESIERQGGKPC